MSLRFMLHPLAALVVVLMVLPLNVMACECPETDAPPPCALFWRSSIVFVALVKNIDGRPNKEGIYPRGTLVQLSVQKIYKGSIRSEVLTIQGANTDCRNVFELGHRYLIYTHNYDAATRIVDATLCDGISELSSAKSDLLYIQQVQDGLAESVISGVVLKSKYEPLSNVRIVVKGRGKTLGAITNNQGKFVVKLGKPGSYRVSIVGRFAGVHFSYGNSDYTGTSSKLEYTLNLSRGQCDYREVTVFR
jgi:hypothetical protein